MRRGLDLGVGRSHLPVRCNEVADSLGVLSFRVLTGPISQADFPLRVGKQREIEGEFLGKGGVVLHGVEAYPKDLGSLLLELSESVAEPAALRRSTRGVRFGVEPEDDAPSAKVGESDGPPLVIPNFEVRRQGPGCDHKHLPPGIIPEAKHRLLLRSPEHSL